MSVELLTQDQLLKRLIEGERKYIAATGHPSNPAQANVRAALQPLWDELGFGKKRKASSKTTKAPKPQNQLKKKWRS